MTMSTKPPFTNTRTKAHVLLVEGDTDEHVVGHIWGSKHNEEPPFLITGSGGNSRVMEEVAVRLKAPDLCTLGIMVDADQDIDKCWRDLKEKMDEAGISLPNTPNSEGTIVTLDRNAKTTRSLSKVGVWIAPDNESSGELEDFIATMMPTEDVVWPLAQAYADSVIELPPPRAGKHLIQPHRKMHAAVWAWMASRRQSTRIGSAIRAGDLNVDGELCRLLLAWLEKLFDDAIAQDD